MGNIVELLAALKIRVDSPDGRISGEYRNGTQDLTLEFYGDAYERYHPRELERQLAALAKLLWVGQTKGSRTAWEKGVGENVSVIHDPTSESSRRYRQQLAALRARGMSNDRCVHLETTGMNAWVVTIKDGALDRLTQDQFISEVTSALAALFTDHTRQLYELRQKTAGVKTRRDR